MNLKDIKKIINEGSSCVHNDTFVRRMETNKNALTMEFWESHFEVESLDLYPEITGKILDFGCGSGHLDIVLARKGKTIHGIDLSDVGINIANYMKDKEPKEVRDRVSFSLSDITIDKPTELFDSMWSTQVFEHIKDPSLILNKSKEWLKKDAPVLISVPLGKYYNDIDHVHHFHTEQELNDHLSPYINIINIDTSSKDFVIRVLCKF